MITVVIRRASHSDLESLEKLNDETHEHHRAAKPDIFKKLTPGVLRDLILSYIDGRDVVTFVAEEAGDIVGFVQVKIEEVPENAFHTKLRRGLVNSLGVAASARHCGIGGQLMEAAENWIREKGLSQVLLNVWEFNESAISFYQTRGYSTHSRKMIRDMDR